MSKKKAVGFVLLLWLLSIVVVAAAKASTPQDALKVAWYLKGEGDLVMPQMGLVITDLRCAPAKRDVACKLELASGKKSLCSTGRFTLKGYGVSGQWAKPRACLTS